MNMGFWVDNKWKKKKKIVKKKMEIEKWKSNLGTPLGCLMYSSQVGALWGIASLFLSTVIIHRVDKGFNLAVN